MTAFTHKGKIRKLKSKVYWWPVDWDTYNRGVVVITNKKNVAKSYYGKVVKVRVTQEEEQ